MPTTAALRSQNERPLSVLEGLLNSGDLGSKHDPVIRLMRDAAHSYYALMAPIEDIRTSHDPFGERVQTTRTSGDSSETWKLDRQREQKKCRTNIYPQFQQVLDLIVVQNLSVTQASMIADKLAKRNTMKEGAIKERLKWALIELIKYFRTASRPAAHLSES